MTDENRGPGAPIGNQNSVGNSGGNGGPPGNDHGRGNPGGGAPADNTNAVTHGANVSPSKFYNEVADDDERALIDRLYQSLLDRYGERHGDPIHMDKLRMFAISVNMAKELRAESWSIDRPNATDSGHPLLDREVTETEEGRTVRYKVTPALKAAQTLSRETRQWLSPTSAVHHHPENPLSISSATPVAF